MGVRNPFDGDDVLGTLTLTNGMAVATSGDYERFVTIGGERYAHILDPRSGRPVKGMAGVTVVGLQAVEADALSTAFFVLGPEGARSVLARLPRCRVLLVPDETPLRIMVSVGMRSCFTPAPRWSRAVRDL